MNERSRSPLPPSEPILRGSEDPADLSRAPNVRRIRLRVPDTHAERRPLGWLPRLLGLELYSSALLTRKVRIELSVVAAALLFVFAFELAAWSFFLNGLFAGDMRRGHWLATPAAVALSLIFAGTILFFERQVVIADFPRWPRWKKVMAATVRVVAILVAGFIVAHAVDLLAFHDPVARKLHSEAVQAHARRLQADLHQLGTSLKPGAERAATVAAELKRVREEIDAAEKLLGEAVANEKRYEEEERFLRRQTVYTKPRPTSAAADGEQRREARESARELSRLGGSRAAASATAALTRSRLDELREKEKELVTQQVSLDRDTERHRWIVHILSSRLAAWIDTLERADPGPQREEWAIPPQITDEDKLRWPEEWRKQLHFEEPAWSFFEKVDALYNVILNADSAPSRAPSGPGSRGASPRSPLSYRVSFAGIHLAAMFVPLLVFFIKWFFMSKEVDAYFSVWHQALAGDPDARLMLGVDEHVNRNLAALSATPEHSEDRQDG